MTIVVRCAFESDLLPENLARVPIQTDYLHRLFVIRSDTVRMHELLISIHVLGSFRAGDGGTFDSRCEEDFVSPDDWRRVASARNWGLPLNIFLCVPF